MTDVDSYEPRPGLTHRDADWSGLRVLVAGLGISGFAAANALIERGALVTAVDAGGSRSVTEHARILDVLGVDVRLGAEFVLAPPAGTELVVTSPGWRPDQPLLVAAAADGIPVWGEVELAWRMRALHGSAPWLTVTGTNGKTTTVGMLTSILRSAGLRVTSAGNIGTPLLEAVLHPDPYDVLAVELSSFQLHWQRSVTPRVSACLNVAPDHLDWHGSLEAYRQAKSKVYEHTEIACIYNVDDPVTKRLVEGADVVPGCRAVGFTLGLPGPSMLGIVDGVLADRAFIEQRASSAAELASLSDLRGTAGSAAPHLVADALAAAALARAHGVSATAVREGLRAFTPAAHRIAEVATLDGVRFVDDSKATNPHAAAASLAAFEHVVWVAGGQLKGAAVDDLVQLAAPRLRAAVLIGSDRALLAQALARHAPKVPVVIVSDTETGQVADEAVMDVVVERAVALARRGDVVLLAPAGASLDMFDNYGARGDAFAAAVLRRAAISGEQPDGPACREARS